MRRHSAGFKAKMVQRMSAGDGSRITALALSKEVGVAQTTLSRWLREAVKVGSMHERDEKSPLLPAAGQRPQDWTPTEKLRVVQQASVLSEDELGAFLRREGLYEAHLKEWRQAALSGLGEPNKGPVRQPESRRIRDLERELHRKEKALAETAALLVLRGKMEAFWGVEGDGTKPRNDK